MFLDGDQLGYSDLNQMHGHATLYVNIAFQWNAPASFQVHINKEFMISGAFNGTKSAAFSYESI